MKTYKQRCGKSLKITVYLLTKVENIVAKVEIACVEQFLLLSQCFQILSAAEASICGKGLNKIIVHENTVAKGEIAYVHEGNKLQIQARVTHLATLFSNLSAASGKGLKPFPPYKRFWTPLQFSNF